MHKVKQLLGLIAVVVCVVGCGKKETTVLEPTTYEMTDQEKANAEKDKKMSAEQRQQ